MQHGDLNSREHNSIGTYAKKVLLYGWDSSALEPVKLLADASGNLITGSGVDAYKLSDEDSSEPAYYGYVSKEGKWYIMSATATGNVTAYRFYKGDTGYTTNWTNRATLSYGYFYDIF